MVQPISREEIHALIARMDAIAIDEIQHSANVAREIIDDPQTFAEWDHLRTANSQAHFFGSFVDAISDGLANTSDLPEAEQSAVEALHADVRLIYLAAHAECDGDGPR